MGFIVNLVSPDVRRMETGKIQMQEVRLRVQMITAY